MSESKHTPGPWRAYDNYVEIPGKPLIAVDTDNPMMGDSSNDTHLIAAAPELLASLKKAEDLIGGEFPHDWPIHGEIAAAIAKAEGRS